MNNKTKNTIITLLTVSMLLITSSALVFGRAEGTACDFQPVVTELPENGYALSFAQPNRSLHPQRNVYTAGQVFNNANLDYSSIEAKGLVNKGNNTYYLAEMGTSFCSGVDQYFPVFSSLTNSEAGTFPAANTAAVVNAVMEKVKIYQSDSLSADSLVADSSSALTYEVGRVVPFAGNQDKLKAFAFKVPAKTLIDNQTYYIAFEKGLPTFTNVNDGTIGKTLTETIVLKVTTGHSFENGICTLCGSEETQSHSPQHKTEILPGKAATCTEPGVSAGLKCLDCGLVLEEQTEIPALGHDSHSLPGRVASCYQTGLSLGYECSRCGEILQPQEEIAKLPHTETTVEGRAATCTESGLTEGKKCSVCGEVLEAQIEIPSFGHTETTLGESKAPTCTETGLTEGKKCSICGEILEAQKEIPALGHDYKDGVCTRCGEKDPNYVEPTPEEPAVKLNGLEKGKDGKWALYKDNVVQKDFTGLAKSSYTKNWYYVKNGYVDWDYTGFGQNVNTKKWYRVKDGRVDWDANSIYKKPETGAWYKCTDGRVTFKETGVFKNENGWWYVKNSRVDFNFTGIASNKNGTWYIRNGYVDFNYTGKVVYNGKTYNVTRGHAKLA